MGRFKRLELLYAFELRPVDLKIQRLNSTVSKKKNNICSSFQLGQLNEGGAVKRKLLQIDEAYWL